MGAQDKHGKKEKRKTKIRQIIQRAARGYSDEDVSNFYAWFLKTVPAMLEKLSRTTDAYPWDPASDNPMAAYPGLEDDRVEILRWKNALRSMSVQFRKAAEKQAESEALYEELTSGRCIRTDKLNTEIMQAEKETHDYIKKGVELLGKNFFALCK